MRPGEGPVLHRIAYRSFIETLAKLLVSLNLLLDLLKELSDDALLPSGVFLQLLDLLKELMELNTELLKTFLQLSDVLLPLNKSLLKIVHYDSWSVVETYNAHWQKI